MSAAWHAVPERVATPEGREVAPPVVARLLRPGTILWFNILLAAVAFAGGALSAALTGARFVPPAPRPANAVSDYLTIVSTNEQVLLSMALGLPALGVYGNLVMLCNWFRFGSDCVAILHGSAHELIYIGIHGPLELIALTLAAAAVQELGCAGLGSLVWAQKFRWRAGVRRYALAGALLAVIAVIEVISKGMRAASAHLSLNIWPGF